MGGIQFRFEMTNSHKRPEGDIVYKFDNKEELEKLKDSPFVLKEGCHYKIKLSFRFECLDSADSTECSMNL